MFIALRSAQAGASLPEMEWDGHLKLYSRILFPKARYPDLSRRLGRLDSDVMVARHYKDIVRHKIKNKSPK